MGFESPDSLTAQVVNLKKQTWSEKARNKKLKQCFCILTIVFIVLFIVAFVVGMVAGGGGGEDGTGLKAKVNELEG